MRNGCGRCLTSLIIFSLITWRMIGEQENSILFPHIRQCHQKSSFETQSKNLTNEKHKNLKMGQPSMIWVWKISTKYIKFFNFLSSGQKNLGQVWSKSTWVNARSASYLLQVKSMIGSGQGPSLVHFFNKFNKRNLLGNYWLNPVVSRHSKSLYFKIGICIYYSTFHLIINFLNELQPFFKSAEWITIQR